MKTTCEHCGNEVRVRKDGRLYRHPWQCMEGAAKSPCPAGEKGREPR